MKHLLFLLPLIVLSIPVLAQRNYQIEAELEKKYQVVLRQEDRGEIVGYSVIKNNRHGYCDANGVEIFPLSSKYQYIHAAISDKKRKKEIVGFYVRNGKEYDGLPLHGFVDKFGRELIPVKYIFIFPAKDENGKIIGFEVEGKEEEHGFYDAEGKMIIPLTKKYDYIIEEVIGGEIIGFSVTSSSELEGYLSRTGKTIVPVKYNAIIGIVDSVSKQLIGVVAETNGKCGLFDPNGKQTIGFVYDWPIEYFCSIEKNVLLKVKVNKHYGVVNTKGTQVVLPVYDSLLLPTEGLLPVLKDEKWGFVSIVDGSVVVPIEYDKVSLFQDGVAKVTKNGRVSMIPNPLKVVTQNSNQPKGKGKAVSTYPAAESEVDKNIPSGKKADANTHAFIIANENYPIAKVPYALNDGWTFEKYCKKALGIKDENVHLFEDATGGNILACVEQMKQVAKAANGNAIIIFYYAGHAFPDEEKNSAYLLPVDGDSRAPATGYSLEKLYQELNSVQTKQVICFLDACFSGATRDDQMLIAGRGVAIKVKDEIPQGNMVVMTSATGAETAHSYEEMHHGLFTYYLLEKLQQTKGDVSLGDLSEHVTKMVKRKSVLINQKKQTPTVIPSPKLQSTWQEIKL